MASSELCDFIGHGIWRVSNQVFPSNTYICTTDEAGGCVLVDPGTDPALIDAALKELHLEPRQILCTHGHFDHAGSAAFFQNRYGACCHLHEADIKTLRGSNFLMMAFKIPFTVEQPNAKSFGDLSLPGWRVYPAPGHTPGSCIIQYGQFLFTGDTLYIYGVGLSKLPGENAAKLKTTLLALWDELPADALVCPGHGDCALYAEVRRNNKPLLNFLGFAEPPEQEE